MRELYTVRAAHLSSILIEVNSFDNMVTGGVPNLRSYFQAYNRIHKVDTGIPDHVLLKIDEGVEPWFSAAIYDAISNMPAYKACHRMMLLAHIRPQVIDVVRFGRMFYGCRNEAGKWALLNDDDLVVLRANGCQGEPQPFFNRIPADVPRLPELLDHAHLHCT
ncbi:hypothetical protein [Plectonema phage JingP1]|uniref:Uncharacterized protein n=1 Tax=Plectonema phage JingP1 TaxID=2961687 RepID=A0A9E7T2Z2_9CAUD|nr:hypothetical protein [Plectonema phage JingP1]